MGEEGDLGGSGSAPFGSTELASLEEALLPSDKKRMHDESTLRFNDLSFDATVGRGGKHKTIISGINGHAHSGEVVGILGPSGAGKTTLMNVLTLDARGGVARGHLTLGGKSLVGNDFARQCAVVTQHDSLWAFLTCRETVRFAASLYLHNLPAGEREARVRWTLRTLGLEGCADTRVGNEMFNGLSGGEKKRLSIATALIKLPRVLFMDEPTSSLDAAAAVHIMQSIQALARETRVIVVATIHQPSTAVFDLFDRLLLLSRGRTAYCGLRQGALPHFESLGRAPSGGMTAPEFLLDMVNADFTDSDEVNRILDAWPGSPAAAAAAAAASPPGSPSSSFDPPHPPSEPTPSDPASSVLGGGGLLPSSQRRRRLSGGGVKGMELGSSGSDEDNVASDSGVNGTEGTSVALLGGEGGEAVGGGGGDLDAGLPGRGGGWAPSSFAWQTWVLTRRLWVLAMRDVSHFVGRAVAFCLGLTFFAFVYVDTRDKVQSQILNRLFLLMWSIAVPTLFGVLVVHTTDVEYQAIRKEVRNGMVAPGPYSVAKFLLEVPWMFLLSISALALPLFIIAQFNLHRAMSTLALFSAALWSFETAGQMIAMVVPTPVLGMCVYINFWFAAFLFCGVLVHDSNVHWPFKIFCSVLPLKYGVRAMAYNEFFDATFEGAELCLPFERFCLTKEGHKMGYRCDEGTDPLQCYGRTGDQVLLSLGTSFRSLSDEDTVYNDVLLILAIGLVFKLVYVVLFVVQVSRTSTLHYPGELVRVGGKGREMRCRGGGGGGWQKATSPLSSLGTTDSSGYGNDDGGASDIGTRADDEGE